MSIVTLNLNNKYFQVECSDGQEEALLNAVSQIDTKIHTLKHSSPSASNEYMLLLVAISLQDEINDIKSKHGITSINNDLLIGTLDKVSTYMESLAYKIKM
jgi:cell division protein ZapA (FtsZ GTPase activity inhibitor)